ncbi:MAG: hypothetical protein ACOCRK_03635 [bacterium]
MFISRNTGFISVFRDLVFCFLILWLVNPQTRFSSVYNWNIYGAGLLLWIVFAFLSSPKHFYRALVCNKVWMVWLYPLYIMIASLMGHASFSLYQFTIPFIYIFFFYYSQNKNKKQMIYLIYICILYILIININTLIVNQSNFQVSRLLASSNFEETYKLSSPFIGDFPYIYSLVGISISMIGIYKYYHKLKSLKYLLFAILCIIVIIRSQYMIALLITIFITIILLTVGDIKSIKGIMRLMIFILAIISSYVFLGPLLGWLSQFVSGPLLAQRFEELSSVFNGNTYIFSLTRIRLYSNSINTFLNNVFFGVGEVSDYDIVGGHSQVLDTFARYGIFGGTCFIITISRAFVHVKSRLSGKMSVIYNYVMAAFFLQSIINLSYYDLQLTFYFFIIPMILYLYGFSNKQKSTIVIKMNSKKRIIL